MAKALVSKSQWGGHDIGTYGQKKPDLRNRLWKGSCLFVGWSATMRKGRTQITGHD